MVGADIRHHRRIGAGHGQSAAQDAATLSRAPRPARRSRSTRRARPGRSGRQGDRSRRRSSRPSVPHRPATRPSAASIAAIRAHGGRLAVEPVTKARSPRRADRSTAMHADRAACRARQLRLPCPAPIDTSSSSTKIRQAVCPPACSSAASARSASALRVPRALKPSPRGGPGCRPLPSPAPRPRRRRGTPARLFPTPTR